MQFACIGGLSRDKGRQKQCAEQCEAEEPGLPHHARLDVPGSITGVVMIR